MNAGSAICDFPTISNTIKFYRQFCVCGILLSFIEEVRVEKGRALPSPRLAGCQLWPGDCNNATLAAFRSLLPADCRLQHPAHPELWQHFQRELGSNINGVIIAGKAARNVAELNRPQVGSINFSSCQREYCNKTEAAAAKVNAAETEIKTKVQG